jgi:AraC-like DNA-binding protein
MKEVALIGLVQSIFFAFIILLKNKKKIKDYLLILFFLLVGSELSCHYVPDYWGNILILTIDIIYWILLGPTILLYIQFVIEKNKQFEKKHLLHFIPLFISLVPYFDFIFFSDMANFNEYYKNLSGIMWICFKVVWEFTAAGYLLIAIIKLFKHKQQIKMYYSSIEKRDLKWLLYVTLGFASYIYLSYVFWLFDTIFDKNTFEYFINAIVYILTIYVFGIGVYGYKQEGIFFDFEHNNAEKILQVRKKGNGVKYLKSGLNNDEKDELIENLESILQSKKPYLNFDLTISDLALELQTTIHKLSQVINENYQQNFYDFVNTYRIEATKKLLNNTDYKDVKIMAIAYDCGFNSKSAFYTAFKKATNTTPTEYRNQKLQKQQLHKINGNGSY